MRSNEQSRRKDDRLCLHRRRTSPKRCRLLTDLVRALTAFSHGSAQNKFSRMPIVAAEQSRGSGASNSLAAFSSCLLCCKRSLVVVLIVRLLSRKLTMMTSRSSSCVLGSDMSSRGTIEAEVALERLLRPSPHRCMAIPVRGRPSAPAGQSATVEGADFGNPELPSLMYSPVVLTFCAPACCCIIQWIWKTEISYLVSCLDLFELERRLRSRCSALRMCRW